MLNSTDRRAPGRSVSFSERAQQEIWTQEGRLAQNIRGRVAQSLQTARLTKLEKMMDGANLPDLVRIEGTNLRGIMKSYRVGDRNVGAGEVAASEVDALLGVDAVPLTIARMNGAERVTVQLFVPNQGRWGGANPREFAFFDDLVGQTDRNTPNYLNADGRLVRIDNEQAFNETRTVSTFENLVSETTDPAQLRSILPTREVDLALRRTSESTWRQALVNLEPRQIDAFLQRRRDLIRVLDGVRARYGDDVFRSGRGVVR